MNSWMLTLLGSLDSQIAVRGIELNRFWLDLDLFCVMDEHMMDRLKK